MTDDEAPRKGHSPLPWHVNPAWIAQEDSFKVTVPPILDAEGRPVIDTSEWLTLSRENAQMIVDAVNQSAHR